MDAGNNIVAQLVEVHGGRPALAAKVHVSSRTIERWLQKRAVPYKYALLLRSRKFSVDALTGGNGNQPPRRQRARRAS